MPPSLVRKMRASSLVLGPLLARCGKVILPLPGGCAIGSRPMDLHFKGLSKMGAQITLDKGAVIAKANKLVGTRIYLDFPSVGATENLLMAAALADGETLIENAAREPEIDNLVRALRKMGAVIEGEGTGILRIKGKKELNPASITIIPDRIEAATYLLAGVITHGDVAIRGVIPEHLNALLAKLDEAGIEVINNGNVLRVLNPGRPNGITLKTCLLYTSALERIAFIYPFMSRSYRRQSYALCVVRKCNIYGWIFGRHEKFVTNLEAHLAFACLNYSFDPLV